MELDDLNVYGCVVRPRAISATATTNAEYAEQLHADNAERTHLDNFQVSQRIQRRSRLRAQRSWFL